MRLMILLPFIAVLLSHATLSAEEKLPDGLYAEFTTPRGVFTAELTYTKTPLTVTAFVGRAEGTIAARDGKPFFTGLKWYRVVPGFVIQSGDPDHEKNQDKVDADPRETFPDEFVPGLHHDRAGILSMANAGPDTNSCEFFVTLDDCTRLNYLHSVFGRVVHGGGILPKIRPNDSVAIRILRVGSAAEAFQADEKSFEALAAKAPKYAGAAEPGPTTHFDDPNKLLPTEPPRARTFNFKLANFERITGVKIAARVLARSPSAKEDKIAGAYMRTLAAKLGVAQNGVLAVYFADEKDWRVWIGDDLTGTFMGRPTAAADLVEDGALHAAKEKFLADVARQAEHNAELTSALRDSDRPLKPADLLKCSVDAMLDSLIIRFEPVARH